MVSHYISFIAAKPEILSVEKVDDLAVRVEFNSNSPAESSSTEPYKAKGYYIQSYFMDEEWATVHSQPLSEHEALGFIKVVVKQQLSERVKRCEYQVTLRYHCGEVKSNKVSVEVGGLGKL